ncbi:MAG: hypothetical protein HAW67_00370 [Endozoicomonadaceae bacterium]|nr:hypothetical protein [Endozoicomonadaceae bacterium]
MKYNAEIYFNLRTAISNDKNNIRNLIRDCNLIAHAGGGIDGHKYTNSLQAVENAIDNGHRIIELDLIKTSDGNIVAVHDWDMFNSFTNRNSVIPNLHDFKKSKVYGKYDTLTISDIARIFLNNQKLILVTDKIRDIITLSQEVTFKDRTIVEVFSVNGYNSAINNGFHNVALNVDINKVDIYDWIMLNDIQAVTYRGDNLKELSIAYKNAIRISEQGIQSLIFSSSDLELSYIHDNLKLTNSALYVDFYTNVGC